jgi:fused signal recognition particle receptor
MKIKEIFSTSIKKKITNVLSSKKDRDEIFEDLEELLILSDISMNLVERIFDNLKKHMKSGFVKEDFLDLLRDEIKSVFAGMGSSDLNLSNEKNVILLVGINGSGKTTTAAKIGYFYKSLGKKVLFAAADTFRAAGSSQLAKWGEKLDMAVITGDMGADPGSVIHNSLSSFINKDYDLLIIDTAGRVQTRDNLMKELEKLTKIIKKFIPGGASETLLVVDATMGQNTLDQAKGFKDFSGITGIVLSKVDGTAKGGTVINIIDQMKIPVKFAGTGEGEGDLVPFSVEDFIDSLLSD